MSTALADSCDQAARSEQDCCIGALAGAQEHFWPYGFVCRRARSNSKRLAALLGACADFGRPDGRQAAGIGKPGRLWKKERAALAQRGQMQPEPMMQPA